jgi:L-threonylcarbamoyladenylate synthase
MKILEPTLEAIQFITDRLSQGELVVIPTETVYGLAAHAFHKAAIQKIFETKQRPKNHPLIVHIGNEFQSYQDLVDSDLVQGNSAIAVITNQLFHLWPGPLTLILPKGKRILDIVCGSQQGVAIRIPQHPVTLTLLKQLKNPIVAPSANLYGKLSPTHPHMVDPTLNVSFVLNGGPCHIGIESTIINLLNPDSIYLHRFGAIPIETLSTCIQKKIFIKTKDTNSLSSGMALQHYAPHKPLILVREKNDVLYLKQFSFQKLVIILHNLKIESWVEDLKNDFKLDIEILSAIGDPLEIAAKLFATWDKLSKGNYDALCIQQLESKDSISLAIQDKIDRACASYKSYHRSSS